MISITDGTTTVNLSPDLYWGDENDWHPVAQTVQQSITGANIITAAAMVKGRYITLTPPDDASAWTKRGDLDAVNAWAAIAGQQLTLTIRGVAYTVIFRHHDGPAVEAKPIIPFNDVDAADFYLATFRFMEV